MLAGCHFSLRNFGSQRGFHSAFRPQLDDFPRRNRAAAVEQRADHGPADVQQPADGGFEQPGQYGIGAGMGLMDQTLLNIADFGLTSTY